MVATQLEPKTVKRQTVKYHTTRLGYLAEWLNGNKEKAGTREYANNAAEYQLHFQKFMKKLNGKRSR